MTNTQPMPLLNRHNSEPNLLKTSMCEFVQGWNTQNQKAEVNNTIFALRLQRWPCRRINGSNSKSKFLQPVTAVKSFALDQAKMASAAQRTLPQIRQQAKCIRPPFAPLPFDRLPRVRPVGQHFQGCRDGDLLPCWFSLDAEELDRLHNKIQRRINRRRSLNRLNCPFGEANPKRAIIIEKYKPLRNGIRRALSDYQIYGMDPRKDVEQEIRPRRAEWLRRNKRVSFTSPSAATVTQPASAREFRDASSMKRDLCSQKSSASLEETNQQPVKPILTRKISGATLQIPSTDGFRPRMGTAVSYNDEFAVCPMDYAMFRAWRRGSRLSIDVLNTLDPSSLEAMRKQRPGTRLTLSAWIDVLKRALNDCFQSQRQSSKLRACMAQ